MVAVPVVQRIMLRGIARRVTEYHLPSIGAAKMKRAITGSLLAVAAGSIFVSGCGGAGSASRFATLTAIGTVSRVSDPHAALVSPIDRKSTRLNSSHRT